MCGLPMTIMSAWSGLQCAAIDRAYRSEHVRVAYDYHERLGAADADVEPLRAAEEAEVMTSVHIQLRLVGPYLGTRTNTHTDVIQSSY